MSSISYSGELMLALKTPGKKRTERDLMLIYSHLHRLEAFNGYKEQCLRTLCSTIRFESHSANKVLYKVNDPCTCWYVLHSGSVFIQGSMFLPKTSFGKQIPGTKQRGSQCITLEISEMLVIDYPEVIKNTRSTSATSRQSSMASSNCSHHTKSDSLNSARSSTLDSVTETELSSTDSSPSHTTEAENALTANPQSSSLSQNLSRSQSTLSKTTEEGDDYEENDEDDSISLRSESSIYMKDLVIDVVKKSAHERNSDDLAILMEFTKSLKAFSNMTEPTRKALCKVMVFAWVETPNQKVLDDGETLDSWSVIINGQVMVKTESSETFLCMGESFGVKPTLIEQKHEGIMTTVSADCQFLCVTQQDYYDVLHQGEENKDSFYDKSGQLCMVKERREEEASSKTGSIVIRGSPEELLQHLLVDDASMDGTFAEDYLLTYRAFANKPNDILIKLLDYYDNPQFRNKIVRIILLWVNNHFSDFENNWRMMVSLEKFEEKLHNTNSKGELKLFNIACSAKAKARNVKLKRDSSEMALGFEIWGGAEYNCPIYISTVHTGSEAEREGVKRGDLLIEVNGQNFEKLTKDKATTIIQKNTELSLLLKTSLFPFKEMIATLNNDTKKSRDEKYSTMRPSLMKSGSKTTMNDDVFESKISSSRKGLSRFFHTKRHPPSLLRKASLTIHDLWNRHDQEPIDDSVMSRKSFDGSSKSRTLDSRRTKLSSSNPDLLDPSNSNESPASSDAPEDVLKIFRSDQSSRYVFVNRETTANEVVQLACREFAIVEEVHTYSLYKVSVQCGKFLKQSKISDLKNNLADIRLGERYYLKKLLCSEQLLPDENIGDLQKEENYSFLDLNCFEVALHLTREDYKKFQSVESTHFIEDLFGLSKNTSPLREFEGLVNREHFWVATMICSEQNLMQRAKIIKHVVKVAHHCKMLKNLNSTFALVSGLGYRSVSRMKQTWDKVPTKSYRMFDELQALMDPSRNMSKYRTLYNELVNQPPVIPYIPVVKKDLTFLDLGNDTRVDGLINFEKMRMIAREVRNICRLSTPDANQLIPSAIQANQSSERSSNASAYQTLARRGRRASFNNARRMYEDQVNHRRVRQFMSSITIIEDEDQLMTMSKAVESLASVSSSQTKRRAPHSGADSPSRSSKTLPGRSGSASSGSSQQLSHLGAPASHRNNSEPQIAQIPAIALHPTRRKVPLTSLPKFGATSPRALKKMMALSVEGHEQEKKMSKLKPRSSSAFTPLASPTITRASQQTGGSSVGQENINRNNNRVTMTTNARAMTSSSMSLVISSSSGSTSPVSWSNKPPNPSNRKLTTTSMATARQASPVETIMSSKFKQERPIIMTSSSRNNRRTSSLGIGPDRNIVILPDRRASVYTLTGSSSTPSLASSSSGQGGLILPNHPQIPRTSSCDSGIISTGSTSAESSTRLSQTEDSELFARHPNHPMSQTNQQRALRQPIETLHEVRHGNDDEDTEDKIEQSFLSGCRGFWGSPQIERKDPPCCQPPQQTAVKGVKTAMDAQQYNFQQQQQQQCQMMFAKKVVRDINDYLVFERYTSMKSRLKRPNYDYLATNDVMFSYDQPAPGHLWHDGIHNQADLVFSPAHHPQQHRDQKRSDESIEEQLLVMELEKQALTSSRHRSHVRSSPRIGLEASTHHLDDNVYFEASRLPYHPSIDYDDVTLKRSHFTSPSRDEYRSNELRMFETNNYATAATCRRQQNGWCETDLDPTPHLTSPEWQVESSEKSVDSTSQPTRRKTPPPPPIRRSSLGRSLQMIQNKLTTNKQTDEDLMNQCYVETTSAPHLTRRSLPSYNEVLQKRLSSNTNVINPRILPYTSTDNPEQISKV